MTEKQAKNLMKCQKSKGLLVNIAKNKAVLINIEITSWVDRTNYNY